MPPDRRSQRALPFPHVVKLSPTSADTAAACLMRYNHLYLARDITTTPSPASQRGIGVHRALASYNWYAMQDGVPPDPTAFIRSLWTGSPALNDEVEAGRDFVASCVRGYAQYLRFWRLAVRHVEELASMPVRPLVDNPDIAVAISGKADVILVAQETTPLAARGTVLTWDIKTSASLPLVPELRARPSTLLYWMLAAYLETDASPILVGQFQPHVGDDVWADLTPDERGAQQGRVRHVVERIATRAFVATKNENCWNCPVKAAGLCPLHQEEEECGDAF